MLSRSTGPLNGDADDSTAGKKKSKKRKRLEKDSAMVGENGHVTVDSAVISELTNATEWILESVRMCCLHDSVNFIDQVIISKILEIYLIVCLFVTCAVPIRAYDASDIKCTGSS